MPASRRTIFRTLVGGVLLCITACATQQPSPARLEQLPAYYTVNGRIAVQAQGRGYSAQFAWTHQGGRDDIDISNPLGQVVAQLKLTPQGATFFDSDAVPQAADDIETLTAARLGWRLPVAGMRHWLLGLAEPTRHAAWQPSEIGPVLEQDGWRIQFEQHDGRAPSRMTLRRPDLEVRIALYDWQFSPTAGTP